MFDTVPDRLARKRAQATKSKQKKGGKNGGKNGGKTERRKEIDLTLGGGITFSFEETDSEDDSE